MKQTYRESRALTQRGGWGRWDSICYMNFSLAWNILFQVSCQFPRRTHRTRRPL